MPSNQSFQACQGHRISWTKLLQWKIQHWIRQEIIDEDPCDEENFAAQKLYEQFQALEQSSIPQPCPVPSHSIFY